MKKIFMHFIMLTLVLLFTASVSFASGGISAPSYKAGDAVEITGKIAPGQDLYIAIAQQKMFAPKDSKGTHEIKKFKKETKKKWFFSGYKNPTSLLSHNKRS